MATSCSCGGAIEPVGAPPSAAQDFFGTDRTVKPSPPDALLRYGDHARAVAELRLPVGKGPFPLAVVFHGGCWKTGIATPAYMAPLATRWQNEGIATLNVDYREIGDGGGWPGSFADWAAVEEVVRRLSRQYPIDITRVSTVGHSAGGLPAQWLATGQDSDGPVGRRLPMVVQNALVFDGLADMTREQEAFDKLCGFSSVELFMGGTERQVPWRYAAISPLGHAPRLRRLMFVQAVLPEPNAVTAKALRDTGVRLSVYLNPGASHFDVITPGSPYYQALERDILRVLRQR